jgi:hypothetical protein
MLIIKPIMLEGNYVLLRPPLTTDVFGLSQAAKDGTIKPAYLQVLLKEYYSVRMAFDERTSVAENDLL